MRRTAGGKERAFEDLLGGLALDEMENIRTVSAEVLVSINHLLA